MVYKNEVVIFIKVIIENVEYFFNFYYVVFVGKI